MVQDESKTVQQLNGLTVEFPARFLRGSKGRRRLHEGRDALPQAIEHGRIPRVSRLMALAIRFESLIRRGVVRDYAELARAGSVTRARITQIMDLVNLDPRIQEELLFLPPTLRGRDPVTEHQLRPIVAVPEWEEQTRQWRDLTESIGTR